MILDYQWLLNVMGALISLGLGWWMKTMYDAHEALRKQVNDLSISLPTQYVMKTDIRELKDSIGDRFDRLEAKLDRIVR